MSAQEIVYETSCNACDEHRTDLGILQSLDASVNKNFSHWLPEKRQDLVIMWFDKIKAKETTLLIQSFKKTNIKEINK